jgi:uncharacterized protein with GYD domain
MPTYIMLCKFTAEGLRGAKEAPQRRQRAREAMERLGGRAIGNWLTQGRFDVVWVAEFPDDASASAFALATGMAGRLTTETLRAYTPEEADQILARLPEPAAAARQCWAAVQGADSVMVMPSARHHCLVSTTTLWSRFTAVAHAAAGPGVEVPPAVGTVTA